MKRPVLLGALAIVIAMLGWSAWIFTSPDPFARLPHWLQMRPWIYVRIALGPIEAQSFRRAPVDWTTVTAQVDEMIAGAVSASDTYPAIRFAMDQLGDAHDALVPPPVPRPGPPGSYGLQVLFPERVVAVVYPDSAAGAAGIRPGDRVQTVEGHPPMVSRDVLARGSLIDIPVPQTTLVVVDPAGHGREVSLSVGSYRLLPAETHRIGTDVGFVALPGTSGEGGFASAVRAGIARADAPSVCGWIVDLRRANGGLLDPMLLALRPLLGEPPMGSWVDGAGHATPWTYPTSGPFAIAAPVVPLAHPMPPIAVLTSRLTTGSGEAVAVAFRARAATRSFGEPTWGMAASLTSHTLPDGARLQLTAALAADRSGAVYHDRLDPDARMPIDWAVVGLPTDPIVVAAATWLRTEPACRK